MYEQRKRRSVARSHPLRRGAPHRASVRRVRWKSASSPPEAALRRALQCLRTRAGDIPDAAARERFLQQVPENARTLELARQRWGTAEVT
jgi:hypothetical protein